MSFLDVMSCGLGAVILFFMIINAQVRDSADTESSELMGETTRLEFEVLDGRKNLVLARNTKEQLDDENVRAEGQIAQIIALLEQLKAELSTYDKDTLAKIERIGCRRHQSQSVQGDRRPAIPDRTQSRR